MEYQHGGDIYTNRVAMDYSANINPLGLPEGVKKALLQAVENCSCYPDSRCGKLITDLGAFHGFSQKHIICGNGAADLIFQIVQVIKPGRALLTAPSFLEYEQALETVSSEIIWYDLKETDGFHLSVKELIQWLKGSSQKIEMLFLCNPNNPTGFALPKEEMKALLDVCSEKGIFCVVDECFNEFLDDPNAYSVLDVISKGGYDHVFVLKAFTKIYAMAGVRLGYGISTSEKTIESMNRIRQPWSVSALAQAAGEAALDETEYVKETRRLISGEREYLKKNLDSLGFLVFHSMANYLFFKDTRKKALSVEKLLYKELLDRQVLIRSCSNYRGLDHTYYRICVKQRMENDAFLAVLKSILTKGE
jgi:threonine-phosphate decarboxylase